ncbi:MAG: hypothetical protein IPK73_19840 [Candidatus Obscuribacter sp.]|nr:hypothetical protein [Candidatus Obscuribacter sp.]MBK9278114.1 hypothetical protein [Candidatus Obscuribacter sp.]
MAITEKEVLDQLDQCSADYAFPMLDNGYVYPITQRLNCYGDGSRWAIIIEAVGYSVRGGDHYGMTNCLHVYGNCLDRDPGVINEDFLGMTDDGPDGPTFDEDCGWYLTQEAGTLTVRGEVVSFDLSASALEAKGITMVEDRLSAADLFRSLLPECRGQFLATEDELRQRIPKDLPLLLRLDEWYHPDVANCEKPSANETFQQIASVLVSGNAAAFVPTRHPNTHWKNWPGGGIL